MDPFFIPYTKMNSKQIVDLNVKAKTIKLLAEDTGVNLGDLGLGNGFLDTTSKSRDKRENG